MTFKFNISTILLSPWAAMLGLAFGGIIGFEFPTLTQLISPFGELYIALLQMCVLPLIISALISSFALLTRSAERAKIALKLTAFFLIFMVVTAFIGFLFGLIGGTGYIDEDSKSVLGQLFLSSEELVSNTTAEEKGWGLVNHVVPMNFFEALSTGRTLEVVFFSVLLGVALGFIEAKSTDTLIELFRTAFEAIFIIIKWILHGLPLGILCIVAQQVSISNFETIMSLIKFVTFFCIGSILLFITFIMIMSYVSKRSPIEILSDMQETLLIAIGTQSFIAVIPQLIENLEKRFHFSKEQTHLIVPLAITINRQGVAFLFALTGITVAQMYDISLGPLDILFLVLGMSLISMAAIGPLIATAPLMALILEPLGLPTRAAIVLITTTAPILTPFTVMVTAQGIATLSTLLFYKKNHVHDEDTIEVTMVEAPDVNEDKPL